MNGKYNQPTAHMLQPVKGWDSMAHLDFVAPIASTVADALPGTVMHLNSFGELEPGLTAQGMGMYLFYKMWDEDVQPYPLTEDGTRMTAVGMQSFGGYNSEVYLRTWDSDSYNTNGHASNVGAYQFDDSTGAGVKAKVKAGQSAHTTYPAICGMELSSTEFAAATGAGVNIIYDVNDTLTSPTPATYSASKPGNQLQQTSGGFLMKGSCYVDPICGIVSKKPVVNEHGYKQICFWSTWLPAVATNTSVLADDATLKVSTLTDGDGTTRKQLIWVNGASTQDMFKTFTVTKSDTGKPDTSTAKNWSDPLTSTTNTETPTAGTAYTKYVKLAETSVGANLNDYTVVLTKTVSGTETAIEIAGSDAISWKKLSAYPAMYQINADSTVAAGTVIKLKITQAGLATPAYTTLFQATVTAAE